MMFHKEQIPEPDADGEIQVFLPGNAISLDIKIDRGVFYIYALVDPDQDITYRTFRIFGPYDNFTAEDQKIWKYFKTIDTFVNVYNIYIMKGHS